MDASTQAVIDRLETQLREHQRKASDVKRAINSVLDTLGLPPRYPDVEENAKATVASIKGDRFYGVPQASAVRDYLEMRRASSLGPATTDEIFVALAAGGFLFDAKLDEEAAKRGLAISMAKNSVTFHRLPNGTWGMSEWYPNKPKAVRPQGAESASVDGLNGEESESEKPEKKKAKS